MEQRPATPADPTEDLDATIAGLLPASPTTASLVVRLSRLARAHEAVLAELNEHHGLLPSETGVLIALSMAGEDRALRPSVLSASLEQTTGGMTATLRRLESAGLVDRIPDPADGRVSLARLTDRGLAIGSASFRDMAAWFDRALAGASEPRRTQLLDAVEELFSAVEAGRRASTDPP